MTGYNMYNKIHNAIRGNAESQNCTKLLRLLDIADSYNLRFLYAYRKHFFNSQTNEQTIIRQIEVIDPYCRKKFKLNLSIIKNDKDTTINLIDTYRDEKATNIFNIKEFNLYMKRFNIMLDFLKELNKFNLEDLPIID